MASTVNPTRMELNRLKRRLVTATRGHKLLKDKQDEMARQFMILIRQNRSLRREVEDELASCMGRFSLAESVMGEKAVNQAFIMPATETGLVCSKRNIMGVEVPELSRPEGSDREIDLPYGFAFTSGMLDTAVISLAELYPKLIQLAECEKACDMLAAELERTRRRVNALEHIMIPEITENIRMITMKLEDSERSSIVRLMKVKELMAAREQ